MDQWQSLFDIQKVLQKFFIARKSTVFYGNSNHSSQGDSCNEEKQYGEEKKKGRYWGLGRY